MCDMQVYADIVRYELDEFYFMPDPGEFILTHFPRDPSHQLLMKPVSLDEFEHLVPVKSTFFKYGLELASHTNAIVSVDEQTTIVINCPPPEVRLSATSSTGFSFMSVQIHTC